MNKMDEIIEENNIKYNNLYKEIIDLRTSLRLSVKYCITKFANNIYNISDTFNNLSKQIKDQTERIIIDGKEEPSDNVPKISITSKDILKFRDENNNNNEKKDKKNKFLNFFHKRKNTTFFERKININNIENNFQSKKENKDEDKDKGKKNIEIFSNIIQKIIGETELKSMEIIDLYNILELNQIETKVENKYANMFLNMLKKKYKRRIITLKNKNNFIHLSNIMNSFCLKHKNNNNILILII